MAQRTATASINVLSEGSGATWPYILEQLFTGLFASEFVSD
jgi:hypothetical protein